MPSPTLNYRHHPFYLETPWKYVCPEAANWQPSPGWGSDTRLFCLACSTFWKQNLNACEQFREVKVHRSHPSLLPHTQPDSNTPFVCLDPCVGHLCTHRRDREKLTLWNVISASATRIALDSYPVSS